LATANALRHRGIHVDVYEQAEQLSEVGAGVLITPNASRLLARMGMGHDVGSVGVYLADASHYYRSDGTPVAPVRTTDSRGEISICGMHRADLIDIFRRHLPPGSIHTGHRCVDFSQDDDGAYLTFENGATARADVVVAADGIHSILRGHVAEPADPVHAGSVAFRGLLPAELVPGWPQRAWEMWMGDGKHFLVFPTRRGELLNYVGFVPSTVETRESWSAMGDPRALAQAFTGWNDRIDALLAQVTSTFWWGLYDREPLKNWTLGRLALVGDAAHPMLPHLGQGANQSIEDSVALSVMLGRTGASGDVSTALGAYESLRYERTKTVQSGSRANGSRYDSAYADLNKRDAELGSALSFRAWLYDYDVEAAAAQAVAQEAETR
jgi:salicylate hydroxylase